MPKRELVPLKPACNKGLYFQFSQIGQVGVEADSITPCVPDTLCQTQNLSGAKSGAISENAVFTDTSQPLATPPLPLTAVSQQLADPSLQLLIELWDKIPDSLKLDIVVRITGAVASLL